MCPFHTLRQLDLFYSSHTDTLAEHEKQEKGTEDNPRHGRTVQNEENRDEIDYQAREKKE